MCDGCECEGQYEARRLSGLPCTRVCYYHASLTKWADFENSVVLFSNQKSLSPPSLIISTNSIWLGKQEFLLLSEAESVLKRVDGDFSPTSTYPPTHKQHVGALAAQDPYPHHPIRTMSILDGATCYFCLEEGSNEVGGEPLVRDCSCRGDSGFAHLSCIDKYAKQKSKQAGNGDLNAFALPWTHCPNCHQRYQNQLKLDLSSAFVSFAEESYGMLDKMRVMTALRLRIITLSNIVTVFKGGEVAPNNKELMIEECETRIRKMLTMVGQVKKDMKMDKWLHMPKTSVEYETYKHLSGKFEADAYECLVLLQHRTILNLVQRIQSNIGKGLESSTT